MKIAWFTPFSSRNAIGHYSSVIYPELTKYADVTIFVSDVSSPAETWLPKANLIFSRTLGLEATQARLRQHDICIYNLGDHFGNHGDIYFSAMEIPGISIVHDLVMNHFFSGLYFARLNNPQGYVRELLYSHGEAGKKFGEDVASGRVKGDGIDNVWMSSAMLEFHMARSALRNALAVVAHSRFACEAVQQFASFPVQHIHFPVFVNSLPANSPVVNEPNKIRLLTFGNLNSNKAVHLTIEAIAHSPLMRDRVVYDLIGDLPEWYKVQLDPLIERHNLRNQIRFHGFVSDETLAEYVGAADVIINLRNPHFGESSASLMQSLWYGKSTVVWKHGYYDEFPETTVAKVNSVESLQMVLELLVKDETYRLKLGQNGASYAHQTFSTLRYCESMMNFIEEVLRLKPAYALADHTYKLLREFGVDQRDQVLLKLIALELGMLT
jgi:glycosyltransferase involved in cell wall biosynthesis